MEAGASELVSPRAIKKQLMDYVQDMFMDGLDLPGGVHVVRVTRPTDNLVLLTVQTGDVMPRQFELSIKAPW